MEWRDIPGYEGLYQASNTGEIRNKRKVLSQFLNNNGYKRVNFTIKGIKTKPLVHRLIALAFVENPNNYTDVNHKDNCRTNNNSDNLEWVNHSTNIKQVWKTGARSERRKKCREYKTQSKEKT